MLRILSKTLLGLFVPLLLLSCLPASDANVVDYPIVVTAKEIGDYYGFSFDTTGQYETCETRRYLDFSKELDYTYDLAETIKHTPLYYYVNITKDRNTRDASLDFTIQKEASIKTMEFSDLEVREVTSIPLPGKKHYYGFIYNEGSPIGMIITILKGKVIYTSLITGIYTEDHSFLRDLVLPRLKNLEHFEFK